MSQKVTKCAALCSFVFLTANVCHAALNQEESLTTKIDTIEQKIGKKEFLGKNTQKPPVKEYNELTLGGEFLCWQTMVSGDTYVLSHTDIDAQEIYSGAEIDTNQKARSVSFDYDPAFRLWASYELPFDEWNIDLKWTRLCSSAQNSVARTDTLDLHGVWDSTNVMLINSASGKMKENFNAIDLNFGKTLLWSRPFSLNYFFGLKGAFVHEKFEIIYDGSLIDIPTVEGITLKNYFNGVGLNNGIRLDWSFGRNFGLYARGEVAVLWGKYRSSFQEDIQVHGSVNKTYPVSSSNPSHAVKANLVAEAGINWHVEIAKCVRLAFFAGYEFNYWPNQIVWSRLLTNEGNLNGGPAYIVQSLGDLGFQGFNVGASISF